MRLDWGFCLLCDDAEGWLAGLTPVLYAPILEHAKRNDYLRCLVMKKLGYTVSLIIIGYLLTFVFLSPAFANGLDQVSVHERLNLIRRSRIWSPTSIPSMDLYRGPQGSDSFQQGQLVKCKYVEVARSGSSPKFYCKLDSGEVVKVRYGRYNTEVNAQVAASRLLWALGFGANANYQVRVECVGCSLDPWQYPGWYPQTVTFDHAMIERLVKGDEIHEKDKLKQGWSWQELEQIEEESGGASRAQVDALKLLAVFISHVDSRPDNQKLICLEGGVVNVNGQVQCTKPFMYLTDVGTTFGGARETPGFTTLKLRYWTRLPLWKDRKNCIAGLEPTVTNNPKLRNPKISEEGRKFLADLLDQLSNAQIRDMFRAARADQVEQHPGYVSLDEWVEAFNERRAQIVKHRCKPDNESDSDDGSESVR